MCACVCVRVSICMHIHPLTSCIGMPPRIFQSTCILRKHKKNLEHVTWAGRLPPRATVRPQMNRETNPFSITNTFLPSPDFLLTHTRARALQILSPASLSWEVTEACDRAASRPCRYQPSEASSKHQLGEHAEDDPPHLT